LPNNFKIFRRTSVAFEVLPIERLAFAPARIRRDRGLAPIHEIR